MLSFLMRKERYIQSLIGEYVNQWLLCVQAFDVAWKAYVETGIGESFNFRVAQTHREEARADDLRYRVELEMYGKALLPEGRGDILGVLEAVDRLLGDVEWVLYELQLQELRIPPSLIPSYQGLIDVVLRCCTTVAESVRGLFVQTRGVEELRKLTDAVDGLESEADHLAMALIKKIFAEKDLDTGDKLLLKNIVMLLSRVTDRAEHVAHRVRLVSVKRRV